MNLCRISSSGNHRFVVTTTTLSSLLIILLNVMVHQNKINSANTKVNTERETGLNLRYNLLGNTPAINLLQTSNGSYDATECNLGK